MPARSQAQRAYLNSHFGHDWVVRHGFDNTGKLPEHVKPHSNHHTDHHAQTKAALAHHHKTKKRRGK